MPVKNKDKEIDQAVRKLGKKGTLRKGNFGQPGTMAVMKRQNKAKTGSNVEKMIKAKAMYVESNGKKTFGEIAKAVGIADENTIYKWSVKEKWHEQTQKYQQQFRDEVLRKLHEELTDDQALVIQNQADEKLLSVVQELVGSDVSKVVAEFLAKIHTEDFKDIDLLNKAIRRKLLKDEEVNLNVLLSAHEKKTQSLTVKELKELVDAKIALIKGVRLMLGQTTENTGHQDDGERSVQLIVTPEQADSLRLIQDMKVVDAVYTIEEQHEE